MITHPHAGEQARLLAEAGTVLRTRVGGVVHGTSPAGEGDRDEVGVCLEPEAFVTGGATVLTPGGRPIPFERYEVHTAWARARGQRERSGPGDLDLLLLGARSWARLAERGDPAALLPLWVPDEHVLVLRGAGRELRSQAHRFVSRAAGRAALGTLRAQWVRAGARRGRGPGGYAPRPAAHALRTGLQGLELLRTGSLQLPVPGPELAVLRAVRAGTTSLREVRRRVADLDADLEHAVRTADVPAGPDRVWLHGWLARSYAQAWRT